MREQLFVCKTPTMVLSQLTKKAQTWEFWRLLAVALPLGFGLYYGKKFHKQLRVPPIIILPAFLVFPAGVFYSKCQGVESGKKVGR